MRLGVHTMKFSGNLTDLKKYLEKQIEDREIEKIDRELLEQKDKEDEEFMKLHQGDNQSFSG